MTGKGKNTKRNGKGNNRGRKNGGHLVHYSPSPIPSVMHIKMPYYTQLIITGAASTEFSYGFRLNSVFDPDFTLAGVQPNYYDQMAALYFEYRVVAADLEWTISNQSADPVRITWFPTTANSVDPAHAVNAGQRFAKNQYLANTGCYMGTAKGKMKCKVSKLWGVSESVVHTEDDFASINTSNPNNVLYFWLCGFPVGSNTSSIKGEIKITYYVDWFMPKIITGS